MPNYRRGNYDFVVDSSFQPFSMQELLTPLLMYKDAYEQTENAFQELIGKTDNKFSYLKEATYDGSTGRKIYENYTNDLTKYAEDLAKNGLNMGNRRALANLKRRYQGEIGRLVTADEALQQEKQWRRQMGAKDPSMLYAADNLRIDDFLDGQTPNLYSVSGNELYTRGATAGKAASSRVYSAGDGGRTLGGYYRIWVEKNGYSKESMDAFRANASSIPELQQAADAILQELGVTDNLTGRALERARQSVVNGIIDGAVYAESSKPVEDKGVLSAAQRISYSHSGGGGRGSRGGGSRGGVPKGKKAAQSGLDVLNASVYPRYKNYFWTAKSGSVIMSKPGRDLYASGKDPVFNAWVEQNGLKEMALGRSGPGQTAVFNKLKTTAYTTGLTAEQKTLVKEYEKGVKEEHKNNLKQIQAEEKDANSRMKLLKKLTKEDLAHNDGFNILSANGAKTIHYSYIGATARHNKGNWYHGALGADDPGHKGWGWTSDSNVENIWGNFSAEGSDSSEMRVLDADEMAKVLRSSPGLQNAILERVTQSGHDLHTADVVLVEVPNERGRNKVGYLIAVRDN